MNNLDIYQLMLLLSISFMAAFSISLNNFAKDKNKNKQCIPLLYISECLISGLSGFFLSMGGLLFEQNILACMIMAGIGGFAGRKLLFVIVKIIIMVFSASKNIDISKFKSVLDNLDDTTPN